MPNRIQTRNTFGMTPDGRASRNGAINHLRILTSMLRTDRMAQSSATSQGFCQKKPDETKFHLLNGLRMFSAPVKGFPTATRRPELADFICCLLRNSLVQAESTLPPSDLIARAHICQELELSFEGNRKGLTLIVLPWCRQGVLDWRIFHR